MAGVQGLRLCCAGAPGAGSDAEGSWLLCQPESMGLYNKQSIDRSLRCRQSPAASGFLGAAPPIPVVLGTATLPALTENPMSS